MTKDQWEAVCKEAGDRAEQETTIEYYDPDAWVGWSIAEDMILTVLKEKGLIK